MYTEMGIAWKAKIEKMYSELAEMEVGFFPPEEEAKIEQGFDEVRAAKRDFRREARRALAKQRQLEAGKDQTTEVTDKKEEVSATAAAAWIWTFVPVLNGEYNGKLFYLQWSSLKAFESFFCLVPKMWILSEDEL